MEIKGRLCLMDSLAVQPRKIVNPVYTASALLPNRVVDVPVRVLNAGGENVRLQAGTVMTTAEAVTLGTVTDRATNRSIPHKHAQNIADMAHHVKSDVSQKKFVTS